MVPDRPPVITPLLQTTTSSSIFSIFHRLPCTHLPLYNPLQCLDLCKSLIMPSEPSVTLPLSVWTRLRKRRAFNAISVGTTQCDTYTATLMPFAKLARLNICLQAALSRTGSQNGWSRKRRKRASSSLVRVSSLSQLLATLVRSLCDEVYQYGSSDYVY